MSIPVSSTAPTPRAGRGPAPRCREAVAEKAEAGSPKHIAAPFGRVVSIVVEPGEQLAAGAAIGSIEAMNMEAVNTAPAGGTVKRVAIGSVSSVDGGDLLFELD